MARRTLWIVFHNLLPDGATPHILTHVLGREAERFRAKRAKHFTSSALRYEVLRGNKGHYDVIQATLTQPLSTSKFNKLTPVEKKQLCAVIARFLTSVRAFKDNYQ